MNIDERLQALTMNLELASREIQDLKSAVQQDAENIRALAVIMKAAHDSIKSLEAIALRHEERHDEHDHRLDNLENR